MHNKKYGMLKTSKMHVNNAKMSNKKGPKHTFKECAKNVCKKNCELKKVPVLIIFMYLHSLFNFGFTFKTQLLCNHTCISGDHRQPSSYRFPVFSEEKLLLSSSEKKCSPLHKLGARGEDVIFYACSHLKKSQQNS